MQLVRIHAKGYRCLADFELEIRPLNVLIGANAAGKSTVLDLLQFLAEAVTEGSFRLPVRRRGGLLSLAWRRRPLAGICIDTTFREGERELEWEVRLKLDRSNVLQVQESLTSIELHPLGARMDRQSWLLSDAGTGSWFRPAAGDRVRLHFDPATCGLAAASVNAEFGGRNLAEFLRSWTFFDPHPSELREPSSLSETARLASSGRNLAARLVYLRATHPEHLDAIVAAMQTILGFPRGIEFEVSDSSDVVRFFLKEDDGEFLVAQSAQSSGTLRLLALSTALLGQPEPSLVGIEEPENHLHPQAIDGFVQLVQKASETHQILITTHWPGFLDGLDDPSTVVAVRRDERGTRAERSSNPDGIREALRESGFGLGEYFETTGFGA